jgi:hypothetical protein
MVGAPMNLSQAGIFVAIVVTPATGDKCLQHNLRGETIDRQDAVFVEGTTATLSVLTFKWDGTPAMVLNILHTNYCYSFNFFTLSKSVRDANEAAAVQMLNSFRFGTGPVPKSS